MMDGHSLGKLELSKNDKILEFNGFRIYDRKFTLNREITRFRFFELENQVSYLEKILSLPPNLIDKIR